MIKYPKILRAAGGIILTLVTCIRVLGTVFLIYFNTKKGGTLPIIGGNSFFLFSDDWGSGRGIIWKAAIEQFGSLDFLRKLIGVGPDCFYDATRDNAVVFEKVVAYYGDTRLTNCHNTLLTMLNNVGLFGTLAFGGVLFMTLKACLSRIKNHPELMMIPLSIVMYLANNVVSFQTITSITFLFMIIGVGAAMLVKVNQEA